MEISQQTLANMNRGAAAALAKAAHDLGAKATWKPLDRGRTALDQVQECAGLTRLCASIFAAGHMVPVNMDNMAQLRARLDTLEKAAPYLHTAIEDLGRLIEEFPAEKLDEKIVLPFGGGMEKSFAELALMNYWNMVYHEGQINYIQTLCGGDTTE
jgi:hypothetical protein